MAASISAASNAEMLLCLALKQSRRGATQASCGRRPMKEAQPRLLSNMEIVMLVAVILGMLWFWLRDVFASFS
jgi:hypothetical protein